MPKSPPSSGLRAGLVLTALLAAGGGLLYFAGRTFSRGAPPSDAATPLQVDLAASGVGEKSLTMFGCDLSHIPKDSVAAWVAFNQTGRALEVHARDEKGQDWPLFFTPGRGHENCYIVPYGYDKAPQRLVAVVSDGETKGTKEFPIPTLPPPRRYPLPKPKGEISGLKLAVDRGWITVSGNLPQGHVLLGKPLAGELLGPVKAPFAQRVLSEGQQFSRGRFYPPIGAYPQSAQSMAFEFTEMKVVPHHTTVEFGPFDLVQQFGETWIRRGQSKVTLTPDISLTLRSATQIPYREPPHRQTEFLLLMRPIFRPDKGGVRRFDLIEPTTVAGLPLSVEPRPNGIVPVESPLTRTETGPATGHVRVKVAVDYDTLVPVRTAVVIYRWPGISLPPPRPPSITAAPPNPNG